MVTSTLFRPLDSVATRVMGADQDSFWVTNMEAKAMKEGNLSRRRLSHHGRSTLLRPVPVSWLCAEASGMATRFSKTHDNPMAKRSHVEARRPLEETRRHSEENK